MDTFGLVGRWVEFDGRGATRDDCCLGALNQSVVAGARESSDLVVGTILLIRRLCSIQVRL
jgi:hypothetical protein